MQLKTVSESLLEDVSCPDLEGRSDAQIEQLLFLSTRVTTALQSLISFRDSYSNYERLMTRLKSWLQRAEGKIDSIAMHPQSHTFDFWVCYLFTY